jgi:hypothetical protein
MEPGGLRSRSGYENGKEQIDRTSSTVVWGPKREKKLRIASSFFFGSWMTHGAFTTHYLF